MFQFRCRGRCSGSDGVEDVPVLMLWQCPYHYMHNFQILTFPKLIHSLTFGSIPLLDPLRHNAASLFFTMICDTTFCCQSAEQSFWYCILHCYCVHLRDESTMEWIFDPAVISDTLLHYYLTDLF